jgi:hypothetical protein
MLRKLQNPSVGVRFSTEKSIGFPALIGIFDLTAMRDLSPQNGSGRGVLPHIFIELAIC